MKTTVSPGDDGKNRRKAVDVEAELLKKMDECVRRYPSDVPRIPSGPPEDRIAGTAFFPGGKGLYLEDRNPLTADFPFGGVMVLGHNFDSETNFKKSVKRGLEESNKGTWGALKDMLSEAGVPMKQCFFTNAFMGLCKGAKSGDYRGRDRRGFRRSCLGFLKEQIEIQKPRLIMTLGLHVPPLLERASPDCLGAWKGVCRGVHCDPELHLQEIDAKPMVLDARFRLRDGLTHQAVVVPLAHPSDGRNTRKRRPIGFSDGIFGEVELIRAGYVAAVFHHEDQLPCMVPEADKPRLTLNPELITAAIQGCEAHKKQIEQRTVELRTLLEGRTKH